MISTPSRRPKLLDHRAGHERIGSLAGEVGAGVAEEAVAVGVHFEHARAGDQRQGLAVFVRLELGAAILAVLLLAVGSTTSAASTTAAASASALAGAAVVSTTAACRRHLGGCCCRGSDHRHRLHHRRPLVFVWPCNPKPQPFTRYAERDFVRGRKKEIRMSEIEVRHLPAARGRKMLIQLNKPGLEALVEIVASFRAPGGPGDLSPCSGVRVTTSASENG